MRRFQTANREEEAVANLAVEKVNELQAAIGRVELRNIDTLNEHRREIAARYNERLEAVPRDGTPFSAPLPLEQTAPPETRPVARQRIERRPE